MATNRDDITESGPRREHVSARPPVHALPGEVIPDDARPGTLPPGNLLKRGEAARVLGVSVSTLRRMEGTSLRPIVGPDGVRLFRSEEVQELTVHRVRMEPQKPSEYDGATAARVFALLDDGVHPVDVVKQTQLDPRAVTALHKEWVRMRGGFIVSAEHVRDLEELNWIEGIFPISDAAVLLENLRASGPRPCIRCKRREPAICAPCAKHLTVSEAKRADQDDRDRRARADGARRRAQRVRDDEGPAAARSMRSAAGLDEDMRQRQATSPNRGDPSRHTP